jgi:hypothetical protein
MSIRDEIDTDRAGRLARRESANARVRRRAAELTADTDELPPGRDGAIDPAHRLLVMSAGDGGK